jgi:hypothetical protein
MKRFFVMIALLLACSSHTVAQIIMDGNAEVRTVGSFNGIKIQDAFDVYLTQSNEEAVAVSSNNDKRNIVTEVKNGILHISVNTKGVSVQWGESRKLKAYISFKKINQLDVKGACNVSISGTVRLDELSIKLSGASDFKCKGKIDVNKMAIDISGASDLFLIGSASFLYVEASGASTVKASDFSTDICDIRGSGASDIHIKVNKELSAQVSGASDLRYKGDADLKELKSTGASSIKRIS